MMKQNYQREDCSQMIDIFLNILGVCQTNKYLRFFLPHPTVPPKIEAFQVSLCFWLGEHYSNIILPLILVIDPHSLNLVLPWILRHHWVKSTYSSGYSCQSYKDSLPPPDI